MTEKLKPIAKELWLDTTEGFLFNQHNGLIAKINGTMHIPTANEIVSRYNSHPDLLAACEEYLRAEQELADIAKAFSSVEPGIDTYDALVEIDARIVEETLPHALEAMRAAVKKARGEA